LAVRTQIRNRLVSATVKNAKTIPFYQRKWNGIEIEKLETVADLASLPSIARATDDFRDSYAANGTPLFLTHTTGTTTGTSFVKYRTLSEVASVSQLLNRVQSRFADSHPGGSHLPIVISTISRHEHGNSLELAPSAPILHIDTSSVRGLERASSILGRKPIVPTFEEAPIDICSVRPHLVSLIGAMHELGPNPNDLAVRTITTLANGFTPHFQNWLQGEFPTALLIDRYSLSEMIGGATLCHECSTYHIDVTVAPEIIDPISLRPLNRGPGELVLTELFPFSQYQPLIRYRTGDLVDATSSVCEPEELSFRLVGRVSETPLAVVDGRARPLVEPLRVWAMLDRLVGVARAPLPDDTLPELAGAALGEPVGRLQFNCDSTPRHIRLTVGAAFDPLLFPDAAEQLSSTIRAQLLRDHPLLERETSKGCTELEILLNRAGLLSPSFICGPVSQQ